MFILEFLPARHGDCILVRWGSPPRLMVIDGGPDGVYEDVLRPRLMSLSPGPGRTPVIDVLCVTHVDDDHVVGVLRLLTELARARRDQLPLPIDVKRFWFNSVDELIDGVQPGLAASVRRLLDNVPSNSAVAAGYGQGRSVRDHATTLGLPANMPFDKSLTVGAAATLDDLETTVVGPSAAALAGLVAAWQASACSRDVAAVSAAYADRRVPNLSSIALHLRCGVRTALLTGDARGDHLLAGLETARVIEPGGRLHVDVFKLPHHGSANNAKPELFDRIRADHYVICSDGVKHPHPSPSTLNWLVESREPGDEFTVHLTHPIPAAEEVLASLAAGRSFAVQVGQPRVEIDLEQ